ncbi:hypothetical protein NL676_010710 [Syzygium grande]|nr:hypothetical protein NL676_010710 [Syzygium grande]
MGIGKDSKYMHENLAARGSIESVISKERSTSTDVQMLYFAPPMPTLLSGHLNVATLGHDRGPISRPERGGNVLGLGSPPCPAP